MFCFCTLVCKFSRSSAMEPTPAQTASFTTVKDERAWAQIKPDAMASMYSALGFEDTDHYRVLGMISDSDFEKFLKDFKVAEDMATPALRAKAVLARGAAFFITTGKRLGATFPEEVSSPLAKPAPVMTKFKLSSVTNQASEIELVALDGSPSARHTSIIRERLGRSRLPTRSSRRSSSPRSRPWWTLTWLLTSTFPCGGPMGTVWCGN